MIGQKMKANGKVKSATNISTGRIQWTKGGGLQGFVKNDKPLCYTGECAVSGALTSKDRWKT